MQRSVSCHLCLQGAYSQKCRHRPNVTMKVVGLSPGQLCSNRGSATSSEMTLSYLASMGLGFPFCKIGVNKSFLTVCCGENDMEPCKLKHSVVQTQSKPSCCWSVYYGNGGEVSECQLTYTRAKTVP